MGEIIKYEMTWCEYLTPCPYKKEKRLENQIFVGDYSCHQCPYFESNNMQNRDFYVKCNYKNHDRTAEI